MVVLECVNYLHFIYIQYIRRFRGCIKSLREVSVCFVADTKFSLKVRLLNGVKTFHYLLRVHYHNHNKMLVPVLIVIKTLARNGESQIFYL